MPAVAFSGNLEELVLGDERELLEGVLPSYLRESRWFRGKARQMSSVEVAQAIPVSVDDREVLVAIVEVRYLDADLFDPRNELLVVTPAGIGGVEHPGELLTGIVARLLRLFEGDESLALCYCIHGYLLYR